MIFSEGFFYLVLTLSNPKVEMSINRLEPSSNRQENKGGTMKRVLMSIVLGAFILTTGAALAAPVNNPIDTVSVDSGQQTSVKVIIQ
ncbi:hypothetical protein EOPP23_03395 [Endozoicomonas sp. OPT23]|nr:hypothetical protein [Endozoicomonas sp. OPT23]